MWRTQGVGSLGLSGYLQNVKHSHKTNFRLIYCRAIWSGLSLQVAIWGKLCDFSNRGKKLQKQNIQTGFTLVEWNWMNWKMSFQVVWSQFSSGIWNSWHQIFIGRFVCPHSSNIGTPLPAEQAVSRRCTSSLFCLHSVTKICLWPHKNITRVCTNLRQETCRKGEGKEDLISAGCLGTPTM